MHLNIDFCKQSQYNYVHTDKDCDTHLRGEKCRYGKCNAYKEQQEQTMTNRTDMDQQGQTGPDRNRQGQTGTSGDKQGHTGTVPVCP